MQFTLKIHCENAAFHAEDGEQDPGPEVARLLRVIAGKVEDWDLYDNKSQTIHDHNGNDVGRWKLAEEES